MRQILSIGTFGYRCHPTGMFLTLIWICMLLATLTGCQHGYSGAQHDRPFPLGAVSDMFWETQQTNAEAADFIFYDHEFRGKTAELAPGTKRHLESVALRLEHVPFPVVIEQSEHDRYPRLDQKRHQVILEHLTRMGVHDAENRVIIAPTYVEGITATEAAQTYYSLYQNAGLGGGQGSGGFGRGFGGFGGGFGRRNSGTGAMFR